MSITRFSIKSIRGTNAPYAFLFSFAVSIQTFAVDPLLFSRGFSPYAPACSVPVVTSTPAEILFQCLFFASVFSFHVVCKMCLCQID